MASEKITAIVEEIKGLTILELNELVKAVEEEFGVSAAAPVAVAGGAAAAASTIVIIPVRFFFGLLLLVELIYLGLNLRLESRLLTVEFAEDGGVFIDIGLERGDDCRSLSDIYLQLIL